jgi:type II secretory pathway component GspD/PulD (secretin)
VAAISYAQEAPVARQAGGDLPQPPGNPAPAAADTPAVAAPAEAANPQATAEAADTPAVAAPAEAASRQTTAEAADTPAVAAPAAAASPQPTAEAADIPAVAAPAEAANPQPTPARGTENPPKGDLISITYSDAKLQDVLRALAAMREGANITMGPDVQAMVSFNLQNVEWETALRLVTESNGFAVERIGDHTYHVVKGAPPADPGLKLELLTPAEVANLTGDEVDQYVLGDPAMESRPRDERKAWLALHAHQYVKRLEVESRPVLEVVKALAHEANLNFSLAAPQPDSAKAAQGGEQPASRPVTLRLRQVRAMEALRLVAGRGGLSCTERSGVWLIGSHEGSDEQDQPLVLETLQVSFLPVDESLVEVCRGLLSTRGRVQAGVNKTLVVQDTAAGIEAVRRTLQAMDRAVPQVLIEARFFELTESGRKDLGIDWNQLGDEGLAATATVMPMQYSESTVTGSGRIVSRLQTATLNTGQFGVVLHALLSANGARQLANPKIIVTSDQQATIHIGEQTPIIKSSLQTTSSGGTIVSYELDNAYGGELVQDEQLVQSGRPDSKERTYTVRKGYLDLGTKLAVSPSVKTADEVYIRVVPELTSVVRWVELRSGEMTIRYPELYATRVRTEFTIQSGETIAIGGLVSERSSTTERKVPLLGSIPGAGRLFHYSATDKRQAETIIFLTVRIVPGTQLVAEAGVPAAARLVAPELGRIREEDRRAAISDKQPRAHTAAPPLANP